MTTNLLEQFAQDIPIAGGKKPARSGGSGAFDSAVEFTLRHEGGYVANDAGKGASNFGVNKTANPDVDVEGLTVDGAKSIYKTRYWDAIGGDELAQKSPDLARVAFDTAVNMGAGTASQMVRDSGGDPVKLLKMREERYRNLLAADPKRFGKYANGWMARVNELRSGIDPSAANGQEWDRGAGYADIPSAAPPESSSLARGFKESFQQLPQLGWGLVAGAGAAAESMLGEGGIATGIKKRGIEGYKEWEGEIAKGAKESDDWDHSYEKAKQGDFGALSEWLKHGIGYVGGQALQTLATAGIGAVGGKVVASVAAKQLAEKMVAKEVASIAAGQVGKEAAEQLSMEAIKKQATKNVMGKFADIGQKAAVGANAFGMEGGEIFGDLVSDDKNKDRVLTGSELGRAFAATMGAGALEFVGDKVGLDVMLGKSALLKPTKSLGYDGGIKANIAGRMARGGVAGVAAAPIESGTEYLQTGLEEYGKGKEESVLPFMQSEEAQKRARGAAALGALGGAVVGGAGGASHGPQAPDAAPAPNQLADQLASSGGVLSRAATASNPELAKPEPDPLSKAAADFDAAIRSGDLMPQFRAAEAQAPGLTDLVLGALATAKNPNAPESARMDAIDTLSGAMDTLSQRRIDQVGRQWQAASQADGGMAPAGPSSAWSGMTEEERAAEREAAEQAGAAASRQRDQAVEQAGAEWQNLGVVPETTLSDSGPGTPVNPFSNVADRPPYSNLTDRPGGQPPVQPKPSVAPAVVAEEPEKPRKVVAAPVVDVPPQKAGEPAMPASVRQRKAQLASMVNAGFDAIEQRDGRFWLVNHADNYETPLENAADAARAGLAIKTKIDGEAHESINSPLNDKKPATEAQIAADNYSKPPVSRFGLVFKSENPAGSTRSGTDASGKPWSVTMNHHYTGIEGTKSTDGSLVDAFLGSGNRIFVIDQVDPKTGLHDEPKVMVGFRSEEEARQAYLSNYAKGWKGLGAITEMSVPEFRKWVKSPAAALPVSPTIKVSQEAKNDGRGSQAAQNAAGRLADRDPGQEDRQIPGDGGLRSEGAGVLRNAQDQELGNPGAAQGHARDAVADRAAVARLRSNRKMASLAIEDVEDGDPVLASLEPIISHFAAKFGKRAIPVRAKGDGAFDGVNVDGNFFINLDEPFMPLVESLVHEFSHTNEVGGQRVEYPGLAALHQRMFDLIPRGAKEIYLGYLIDSGQVKPGRTLETLRPEDVVLLRSEMTRDFMGRRFNDKAWLTKLGQEKPHLFGNFVRDWIKLLDDLIEAFRGKLNKSGRRGSDRKNIDHLMRGHLKELEEMKAVAMEVAEQWALSHQDMAQRLGVSQAVEQARMSARAPSAAEQAELQAELDAEMGVDTTYRGIEIEEDTTDAAIRKAGIHAEDAFPAPKWTSNGEGGYHLRIKGLYGGDRTVRLTIDRAHNGLYETSIEGAWVGPASSEASGYVSLAGAKDFIRRQIAARELRARGYDLVTSLSPGELDAIRAGWDAINAMDDGARKYPLTDENAHSIRELAHQMGLDEGYTITANESLNDPDNKTLDIVFKNKVTGKVESGLVSMTRIGGKWHVSANTIQFAKSGLGTAFYQLAVEHLARRGLQLSPEPTLSGINTYRRTEQMLAAALRNGISNAMVPHPVQRIYGFQNDASTEDEHRANVARMLIANLRNVRELVPQFDRLRYHPETGAFTLKNGRDASKTIDSLIGHRGEKLLTATDARSFGLGTSTIARALLTQDMLEGRFKAPESFAEPVLYSARDQAEIEYAAVEAKYRDTPQWMRAPNGKPTKLTERQWVQVRTPSFKRWFGDWEKFAGMQGGAWNDANGEVSKVVDANGEPLVVYHGTSLGGFMAFRRPGGERRGYLGIFGSDNYDMARSYVRKGRSTDIDARDDKALLEELEIEFRAEKGRISSRETEDRDVFYYTDSYGQDYGPFESEQDAVNDAWDSFGYQAGHIQPGIYAMFVNLRNPNEENFEGAMWNGSRDHQWVVEVGGELQSDADGRQYFNSKEEAAEFAETFIADDAEGDDADPLSYVRGADEHYTDTDGVVREAIRMGNDGAIIREVIDDGGGPSSYAGEPSDVFVALEPNQLKSADWNTGEFGLTDDLRYNKRESDFTEPEDRVEVSTTVPSAKAGGRLVSDAVTEKWVIDAQDILSNSRHLAAAERAIRNYNSVDLKGKTDIVKALHDTVVDNLVWLHNLMPAAVRERAKRWYDGAHHIAAGLAERFDLDVRRVAGVMAVLSPQKDWFMNASLGERLITVVQRHSKEPWSPAMTAWVSSYVAASKTAKERQDRAPLLTVARRLEGKRLEDLNLDDAAKFVRVFDETYFPRSYRVITPEGGFGEFVSAGGLGSDASDGSVAWGDYGTIKKGISILRANNQGVFRAVSDALGNEHKVRNFYNNIIRPNSADGHVTIDTHAVAAALFKALSGASTEVLHNFGRGKKGDAGPGGNAASGASGLYGLFADAYRDAAKRLGLLPRELQSITWEAIRSIFTPQFKSKRAGEVEAIFDKVASGELTREQARIEAYKLAGGMSPMAWENTPSGRFVQDGGSSFDGDIAQDPSARKERTLALVEAKDKMQVSISAATIGIPWIKELYEQAQSGNELAHAQLQYVAWEGLRDVLRGTSARIKYDLVTGLYGGASEPSLSVTLTFNESDRDAVLAALKQFADNFNQEQIHVRQATKDPAGTAYPDGSYATPVYRWELVTPLDRNRIQNVIDRSGLYGLTFGDEFVEAYYVGDAHDTKSIDEFINKAERIGSDRLLGEEAQRAGRSVARLWPYGRGDGGIGWGSATGVDSAGAQAARASARDPAGDRPGDRGRPLDAATIRSAIHFGRQSGLSILSGASNGSGIRGAEDERVRQATDPRIKRRVYFYSPVQGGIPNPEAGLGGNVYQADIEGLYDPRTANAPVRGQGNAFESAVLDAGYSGYVDPESGVMVVLNSDVPVKHIGSIGDFKVVQRVATPFRPKTVTRAEGEELARKIEDGQFGAIFRAKLQIQAVAPSFKTGNGEARVLASEAPAADQALEKAGAGFRFGEVRMSARTDAYMAARNKTLTTVTPQSVLDADIELATKSLEAAVAEIKAGNYRQVSVPVGPVPHVLRMLGAPTQMMKADASIVKKILVDKHAGDFADVSAREFVMAMYRPAMVLTGDQAGEMELVSNLLTDDGPVMFVVKRDTRSSAMAPLTAAVMSAYAKPVAGSGNTIAKRILSGKLVYADMLTAQSAITGQKAQSQSQRTGFENSEALGKGSTTGGLNSARLPQSTASRASIPDDAGLVRPLTPKYAGWRVVSQKILGGIADKKIKTDVDLIGWIAKHYKGDIKDVPSFSARSPIGFYSELSEQIEKSTMRQAPAAAWKTFIKALSQKGVKPDEVEWTGVNEWLDLQDGKVTKDAVLDYLGANGVQVEETVLGNEDKWVVRVAGDENTKFFDSEKEARMFVEDMVAGDVENERDSDWTDDDESDAYDRAEERYIVYEPGAWDRDVATYGKYTLPGGQNYREVLLTLPVKSAAPTEDMVAMAIFGLPYRNLFPGQQEDVRRNLASGRFKPATDGAYISGHWAEPNVLAHIRVNDRTDSDGKRVLFVEEIQSDWGQAGKKQGFAGGVGAVEPSSSEDPRNAARWPYQVRWENGDISRGFRTLEAAQQAAASGRPGIPRAPFVDKTDKWLALALKRIVKMAVDGGYDKVAFVNGEQSADRYKLSHEVDSIGWRKNGPGPDKIVVIKTVSGSSFTLFANAEGVVGRIDARSPELNSMSGKTLSEIVGKDFAGKIAGEDSGEASGDGLDIGGSGMKTFYDQIVPNATRALLKKLGGGQMETVGMAGRNQGGISGDDVMRAAGILGSERQAYWLALSQEERDGMIEMARDIKLEQPGFTITPALREKASAGLPLFSARDTAAAEAAGFDTSKVWYHGTAAKANFRAMKAGNGGFDELGRGIYFTDRPDYAGAWAGKPGQGGRIIPAFIRRGDIYDLAKPVDSLALAKRIIERNQPTDIERQAKQIRDSKSVTQWADDEARIVNQADADGLWRSWLLEPPSELAAHIKLGDRNTWLARAGYVGARNESSQIPGQIVVFKSEDVRVPWAKFNPRHAGKADLLLSARDAEDTPAFKAWSGELPVVGEGEYEGGPAVFRAYHATTHSNITTFKRQGSKEGFLGQGPYFTTSPEDASANYAGVGPDLTARIENLAEQYQPDDWSSMREYLDDYFGAYDTLTPGAWAERYDDKDYIDVVWDEFGSAALRHAAVMELKGDSDGLVMPSYVKLQNPADATGKQMLTYNVETNEDGDVEDETGSLVDWVLKAREIGEQYGIASSDIEKHIDDILQDAGDGEVSMQRVFDSARHRLLDGYDGDDYVSAGEVFSAIAQEIGYDGIIMDAGLHFGQNRRGFAGVRIGGMKGVGDDTLHIVPFSSNQVKSAIGNNGQFSLVDDDIRRSGRDQTKTPEFKAWFGDSKAVDADGKPLVVYHGTNSDLSAFASDRANYFTADPGAASVYAEGFGAPREGANVYPVYLSIQRPKWMPLTDSAKLTAADLAAIKEEGFDGVFGWTLDTGMGGPTPIAREVGTGQRGMDKIVTEAIPLSPEQIKSTIGNNGQFDPANPDIRFSAREAAETIRAYARDHADVLFRTPKTDAKDMAAIAKAIGAEYGIGEPFDGSGTDPRWDKSWVFDVSGVQDGVRVSAPVFISQKGDAVWVNVGSLSPGMAGGVIYQIAGAYAHNNGKVLIGDPDGITEAGRLRRLENMISLALKYGTTEFMRPHGSMLGWNGLQWSNNPDNNLLFMLRSSLMATSEKVPEVKEISYDPRTGKFTRNGADFTRADFKDLAERSAKAAKPSDRDGMPGSGTLRLASIFQSLQKSGDFNGAWAEPGLRGGDGGSSGVRDAVEGLRWSARDDYPLRESSREIVGSNGRQYTKAQLDAFARVGFEVETPSLKERAKALWQDAGKKLAQGLFDQFAPVRELNQEAYGLLRLAKGSAGAFETLLKGGKLKLTDGVYDFDDGNRGGVIDRLLKPMQGEHHDFLRWVAANRAEGLMAEGRENLFTPEDIAAIKTLADGQLKFDYTLQHGANAGQTTRSRAAMYADSLLTFNEFNRNVLDMASQSGLIDEESRHLWEGEFYVPFYRVSDEDGLQGANIKGGVVRQKAFQKLKGGKDVLNADLMDNTLMNWAHLLDAAAKNRAAKATLEAAEVAGAAIPASEEIARQIGKATGNRHGVVWFMDQGLQRFYLVEDPYIMSAITSLEYAGMRNPVMNAMSTVKHYLTVGVTASPFFKVRNLIRDSIQAVAASELGYNPLSNLAQGWSGTNQKSDLYFRLLAGGGTIHFGTMLEDSEARRVQALVERGVNPDNILDNHNKLVSFHKRRIEPLIEAYNELGNRGETINRAALYKQLIAQGKSHAEASLMARDLMDFSMQGNFATIRFLTQVVPFLNARLQGLNKLGKAARENPQRMALVTGAVAMASLALLALYGDDDDWKKREDWDRDNFWWFKLGGIAFRVPKPFEVGAIGTLAERSAELIFSDEMTGDRFRSRVLALLGDNLSMNPIPQLVKPMLDVYANKDSFSGRPIETMSMERLQSQYRFTSSTSMTARGASTALNAVTGLVGKESLSPVQIDSLIRGYFGWLGTFVVGGVDVAARYATNQPTRPTMDYWKTATGSMVSQLDDAQSRYVSHVYDQARAIEEAYGTWRALQKEGKTEEAADFRAANDDKIKGYRNVEAIKGAISKINQRIREIERSDMDRDAKRDEIRRLNQRKDEFSRRLAA